ncbi:hypothetical protein CEXT_334701 [Caerostris extrusa]|uniref:Uncharacterized protein n=1 Tax=Caerostris extrusa TaxID=172846 RepID=A0AAV4NZQ6_CAEEX|nr:hypothetical protein CEXT_334701 [Caerostris extrusa]
MIKLHYVIVFRNSTYNAPHKLSLLQTISLSLEASHHISSYKHYIAVITPHHITDYGNTASHYTISLYKPYITVYTSHRITVSSNTTSISTHHHTTVSGNTASHHYLYTTPHLITVSRNTTYQCLYAPPLCLDAPL